MPDIQPDSFSPGLPLRGDPVYHNQEAEIMKNRKFTIEVGSAYIAVLALFVLFANMF